MTQQQKQRKIVYDYCRKTKLLETCNSHQCRKFNITEPEKSDLLQDLYLWLFTYDIKKLWHAYSHNHLNALITRVLHNNLYSTTSPFYRTYKKFRSLSNDVDLYKNSLYTDED